MIKFWISALMCLRFHQQTKITNGNDQRTTHLSDQYNQVYRLSAIVFSEQYIHEDCSRIVKLEVHLSLHNLSSHHERV